MNSNEVIKQAQQEAQRWFVTTLQGSQLFQFCSSLVKSMPRIMVADSTFYLLMPLMVICLAVQRNAAGRFFCCWLIALIVWDSFTSS